jgi:hypothetical protein
LGIQNQAEVLATIGRVLPNAQQDYNRINRGMNSRLDNIERALGNLNNTNLFQDMRSGIIDLRNNAVTSTSAGGIDTIIRNTLTQLNTGIHHLTASIQRLERNGVGGSGGGRGGGGNNPPTPSPPPSPPTPPSEDREDRGGGGGGGGLGGFMAGRMSSGGGLLGGLGLLSVFNEVKDALSRGNELDEKFNAPFKDIMLRMGRDLGGSLDYMHSIAKGNAEMAKNWSKGGLSTGYKLSVDDLVEATSKALDMTLRSADQVQGAAEAIAVAKKILPDIDASSGFFREWAMIFSTSKDADTLKNGMNQLTAIVRKTSQEFMVSEATIMDYTDTFAFNTKVISSSSKELQKNNAKIIKAAAMGIDKALMQKINEEGTTALSTQGDLVQTTLILNAINKSQGTNMSLQEFDLQKLLNPTDIALMTQKAQGVLLNEIGARIGAVDEKGKFSRDMMLGDKTGAKYNMFKELADSGAFGFKDTEEALKVLENTKEFIDDKGNKTMSTLDWQISQSKKFDTDIQKNLAEGTNATANASKEVDRMMRDEVYVSLKDQVTNFVKNTTYASDALSNFGKSLVGATGMDYGETLSTIITAVLGASIIKKFLGETSLFNRGAGADASEGAGAGARASGGMFSRMGRWFRGTPTNVAGGGVGAAEGGVAGASGGILRGVARKLPIIGTLLGAGIVASNVATAAPEQRGRVAATGGGGLAGGLAGGMAGAALGTAILPGIGTTIGGILGGVAGGVFGEKFTGALYDNMGKITDKLSSVWSSITKAFEPLIKTFSETFKSLGEQLGPSWEKFKVVWEKLVVVAGELWDVLKPVGEWLGIVVLTYLSPFIAKGALLIGVIVGIANGLLKGLAPALDVITSAFDVIVETVGVITSVLKGDFSGAWEHVKGVLGGLSGVFLGVFETIGAFTSGFVEGFKGTFDGIFSFLGDKGLAGTVKGVWKSLSEFMDTWIIGPIKTATEWLDKAITMYNDFWNKKKEKDTSASTMPIEQIRAQGPIKPVEGVSIWSPSTWFASGINNVPSDGFPAVLHKGEMVLPAPQANWLRNSMGQPVEAETSVKGQKNSNNTFVQGLPSYAGGADSIADPQMKKIDNMQKTIGSFDTALANNTSVKASDYYKNLWSQGKISSIELLNSVNEAIRTGILPSELSTTQPTSIIAGSTLSSGKKEIIAYIKKKATEMGIPEQLALATAWTESEMRQFQSDGKTPLSSGNPDSADWGIMQINDKAHPKAFPKVKTDWMYNIDYGMEVLKYAYTQAMSKGLDPIRGAYSGYNTGSYYSRYLALTGKPDYRDVNFFKYYNSQPWGSFAMGGSINQPTMALMGEDAPKYKEYVIPTNPSYRNRAVDLLNQASSDVGVTASGNLGSGGLNVNVENDNTEVVSNLQVIVSKLDELLKTLSGNKPTYAPERAVSPNSTSIMNYI